MGIADKIILAVCFFPIMPIMFGVLYQMGKPKNGMLFGVVLWEQALEGQRVDKIRKEFFKEMKLLFLVSTVLFLLSCIPGRTSLVMSGQMLWMLMVMVVFFIPAGRANQKMKLEKWEERTGHPREEGSGFALRSVDLQAATEPRRRLFLYPSLVGLLLSGVPVIGEIFLARNAFYGWGTEGILGMLYLTGILCLVFQRWYWKVPAEVVSEQSEINVCVNRVKQYQWSRFWCMSIYFNFLLMLAVWYGMHHHRDGFFIMMAGTAAVTVAMLIAAWVAGRNVRRVCRKYVTGPKLQEDDDESWIFGIFYYNPKDRRTMVEQRARGVGFTLNLAKRGSQIFSVLVIGGTVALILWAVALVLMEDFVPISLKMEGGDVVATQYQEEYRIRLSSVAELELVEELPRMSKRVGSSMETLKKGSFLDSEYHSCHLCLRPQIPPFLKIVTDDGKTYYLNDENPAITRALYQELEKE